MTKFEALAVVRERRAAKKSGLPGINTKATRWVQGRVSAPGLAWPMAMQQPSRPLPPQVLGYLETLGTTKYETEETMQALLARLPPKLTKEDRLHLLDLRPTDYVGLEVVRLLPPARVQCAFHHSPGRDGCVVAVWGWGIRRAFVFAEGFWPATACARVRLYVYVLQAVKNCSERFNAEEVEALLAILRETAPEVPADATAPVAEAAAES